MRGIRRRYGRPVYRARFIPAHAGNSTASQGSASRSAVHPRACGEFSRAISSAILASGSSPRMRGIRRPDQWTATDARFIPAHAGNSQPPDLSCQRQTVHPRACGEFGTIKISDLANDGSSPRMRGIPAVGRLDHPRRRFIPAHAGNSVLAMPGVRGIPVHPRACGEFALGLSDELIADGSSPRMRGILAVSGDSCVVTRFIPAHAGNSTLVPGTKTATAVHPRACGEFDRAPIVIRSADGSSPRMRGIPHRRLQRDRHRRFIPAHAGNSASGRFRRGWRPVHPRACGEF